MPAEIIQLDPDTFWQIDLILDRLKQWKAVGIGAWKDETGTHRQWTRQRRALVIKTDSHMAPRWVEDLDKQAAVKLVRGALVMWVQPLIVPAPDSVNLALAKTVKEALGL
jgi:hypothetical protein